MNDPALVTVRWLEHRVANLQKSTRSWITYTSVVHPTEPGPTTCEISKIIDFIATILGLEIMSNLIHTPTGPLISMKYILSNLTFSAFRTIFVPLVGILTIL
jgi:hypothetical protein